MYSLYINHIHIDDYENISDVRDFIFDYLYDYVKHSNTSFLEMFNIIFDSFFDCIIKSLIVAQYGYIDYNDLDIEVHYGYKQS